MLYNFQPQELPGPGTGNWAFLPEFSLPVVQIIGNGVQYLKSLNAFQPEQVYYQQNQQLQGWAGIVQGQIIGQPLLIPDNQAVSQG